MSMSGFTESLATIFRDMDRRNICAACKEPDALSFVEEKVAENVQTAREIDRIFTVTAGDYWRHRTADVVVEIVDIHFDTIGVIPNGQKTAYFGIARLDLLRFYEPERGRHL
jgi:hypothetical protein